MTPEDMADLAEDLVPVAGRLIAAVHDDGPAVVARLLADVPDGALHALCVVLAAHGDPERSSADALSWVSDRTAAAVPAESLFGPIGELDDGLPVVVALRPSLLHPENWSDEECLEMHAAWRRRQRGQSDPLGDPVREQTGFREWDRRRTARRRAADPDVARRHAADQLKRRVARRAQATQQRG